MLKDSQGRPVRTMNPSGFGILTRHSTRVFSRSFGPDPFSGPAANTVAAARPQKIVIIFIRTPPFLPSNRQPRP